MILLYVMLENELVQGLQWTFWWVSGWERQAGVRELHKSAVFDFDTGNWPLIALLLFVASMRYIIVCSDCIIASARLGPAKSPKIPCFVHRAPVITRTFLVTSMYVYMCMHSASNAHDLDYTSATLDVTFASLRL